MQINSLYSHYTNLYAARASNTTNNNANAISDTEILSKVENYYKGEQLLPLNGGQFASSEFNQKLNAKIQNVGQVSEAQMKAAKHFLDEAQNNIMLSFYKDNQEFINKAITAQKNIRNNNASAEEHSILDGKESLRFLEVLLAYGGKELGEITKEKENSLLSSLENSATKEEIQKQVFDYQQAGLFSSGKYFFDLTFDTLPQSQQEDILSALAVVHSYFSQSSLEVGNFKISWEENKIGDWNNFNISSFRQMATNNLKSWIENISDINPQTFFAILENKESQKNQDKTSDSLMQALLKDSKKSNNAKFI